MFEAFLSRINDSFLQNVFDLARKGRSPGAMVVMVMFVRLMMVMFVKLVMVMFVKLMMVVYVILKIVLEDDKGIVTR